MKHIALISTLCLSIMFTPAIIYATCQDDVNNIGSTTCLINDTGPSITLNSQSFSNIQLQSSRCNANCKDSQTYYCSWPPGKVSDLWCSDSPATQDLPSTQKINKAE